MPRKCCVPTCNGNYDSSKDKVTVFSFPSNSLLREKWLKNIPRDLWEPSQHSVVCEKHFHPNDIQHDDTFPSVDGEPVIVPRKKKKLKDNVVPSVFPGLPQYLSKPQVKHRKSGEDRRNIQRQREELQINNFLEEDKINSFEALKDNFNIKLSGYLEKWNFSSNLQEFLFFKISTLNNPTVSACIKINNLLVVQVFFQGNEVSSLDLCWVLDPDRILRKWSQLENILIRYNNASNVPPSNPNTDTQTLPTLLQSAVSVLRDASSICEGEEKKRLLEFIIGQLTLSSAPIGRRRYNSDILRFAYLLYVKSPACYKVLRESSFVILPHVNTLKRLSSALNAQPGVQNEHAKYLKVIASALSDREKSVAILADEIHVRDDVTYKGGSLAGYAENVAEATATTIQSFMIVSLLGNVKEVVALLPVKNPCADFITEKWCEVTKLVQECGFVVVATLTDNNQINRKMFSNLKKMFLVDDFDVLSSVPLDSLDHVAIIRNPEFADKRIFLLFDIVHLLKCIRNNWINKKNGVQGFIYPSLESVRLSRIEATAEIPVATSAVNVQETSQTMEEACFIYLKELYSSEKNNVLKLAPSLSYKALYPTSIERQKVSLVLRIFNEKTIVALRMFQKDEKPQQTANFLQLILNLWRILNVTSLYKGERLRDNLSLPFNDVKDVRLEYLLELAEWLQKWDSSRKVYSTGCLTKETMSALLQTTCTTVCLIRYLLTVYPGSFVLTVKIQSDSIEARFGLYRQLSGSNYNVSVQQILESEKKLRIMSLLELHSEKFGAISIRELFNQFEDEKDNAPPVTTIPSYFLGALAEPKAHLSYSTQCILVYVAGYVGSKNIAKLSCNLCKFKLCIEKELHAELSANINLEYTSLLNRGGLKYPSLECTEVTIEAHSLFNALISKKYEEHFLKHGSQRGLFLALARKKLEQFDNLGKCKSCNRHRNEVLLSVLPNLANIFLNNYSKIRSDIIKSGKEKLSCKRKLETLR